jgi:hypothetical protein
MMKWLAASLLVLLAGGILPAEAQNRGNGSAWCLQEHGRGTQGFSADCSFRTLAQCKESATGNVGHCIRNPYYGRR